MVSDCEVFSLFAAVILLSSLDVAVTRLLRSLFRFFAKEKSFWMAVSWLSSATVSDFSKNLPLRLQEDAMLSFCADISCAQTADALRSSFGVCLGQDHVSLFFQIPDETSCGKLAGMLMKFTYALVLRMYTVGHYSAHFKCKLYTPQTQISCPLQY